MRIIRPMILALAMLASPPTVKADPPKDSLFDLSLQELAKIEVIGSASKQEQLLQEALGSATIVTQEEIRAFGYRTLGDILLAERSFFTAYDRNYTYPGLRGFSRPTNNKRILVLVNGHRVNENYYEQAFLGSAFPVDVDLIDRVEIVRGPNSALYGTNAMMAVINVITRPPGSSGSLEAAAKGGSRSTGQVRTTMAGGSDRAGRWLASGTYYRSDGVDRLYYREFDDPGTNNGYYLNNDGDEAFHFLGRYDRGGLTLNVFASSREKRIPTASYETLFNAPGTFSRDQQGHLDAVYRWRPAENMEFYSTVAFDRFYYTGDYVYDYPPVTVNRDETWVNTLSTEQRLGWRAGAHKVLVGFELRDDFSYHSKNFDAEPYVLYVDNKGDDQTLGVFAQDEWRLGPRWNITVGARYDEYFGLGGSFNPRAGIVFSPRQQSRLRLLAGRAFRAPNKTELEDAGPWRENVGVGPESLQSYELLWDEYLSSEIRISSSLHHNIISDMITFGPTSDTGEGYFNRPGQLKVSGAEFSADYGSAGGWRVQCSADFNDLSGKNSEISANSPRWMFKARAASPVFAGGLRLGVQGLRMGERETVKGGTVGSYDLLNASLQYLGLSRAGWLFSLAVYNLLDAEYYDPGTENHRQDRLAQDPLNISIKATYTR